MGKLQVLGYSDTDVAEYLYNSQPRINSLFNFLCKDLTKACSTNPAPVPKVNDSYCDIKLLRFMSDYKGLPLLICETWINIVIVCVL